MKQNVYGTTRQNKIVIKVTDAYFFYLSQSGVTYMMIRNLCVELMQNIEQAFRKGALNDPSVRKYFYLLEVTQRSETLTMVLAKCHKIKPVDGR